MKLSRTRPVAAIRLALFVGTAICIVDAAAQSPLFHPTPEVARAAGIRSPQVRLLTEARTYLDLESFDLADKRYRQVLALDPENDDALSGRSEVRDARARFEKDVSEGRRSRATTVSVPTEQNALNAATLARKLRSITIPSFDVHEMSLNDAVELLRQEARKRDTDPDEEERGVNIFLKLAARPSAPSPEVAGKQASPFVMPGTASDGGTAPAVASGSTRISLRLDNVSLLQALSQTAECAGLKIKIEPYAVSLVPQVEATDEFFTSEMHVPPGFFGVQTKPTPSPTDDTMGGSGPPQERIDAKAFLESCGVTFPPGASAVYLQSTQKLVIRNTRANLDLVGALYDEATKSPQPASSP